MNHKALTLIIFFLFSTVAFAQETLQVNLSEAQNYAIEHNKQLKNAKLDITLADRKIKDAVAQGLPQIEANLDWMTYFGYEMEFNLGGGTTFVPTADQIADASTQALTSFSGVPSLGLNAATPQDLYNYQAGSTFSGILQGMAPSPTIVMGASSTAKLQIGQLLFSGQYLAGIQVAKLGKEISERGLDNSILDIKESVTNSYIMALITEKSINTIKTSIANLVKIKGFTNNMYETGMAEQTDVDQISIQVTMLENNLRSMERGLQMVHSMLKFQLGVDNNNQLELTEQLETLIASLNPKSKIDDFDIYTNSTYQLLETQELISKKMIDMQKWSYGPTISGFYTYNQKLLTTGFDMTPNNMAGISMKLPIFSGGSRNHKVAQAKIELEKVQMNKSMVEDQLQLQYKQLLLDLNTAIENYDSQKENVEVAQRVFDHIHKKFEQGMASSLDLTQSNNNYLQAESNFTQATMSLLQAKVALDKLNNQL